MSKLDQSPSLTQVAVIGGGRWARVIAETLSGILPPRTALSIHTPRNADLTAAWAVERGLAGRIAISPALPEPAPDMAAIIANAARDHRHVAAWALERRLPVLVEKPVTLTAVETAELIRMAKDGGTLLCAGHVFLFASYFQRFAQMLRGQGPATALRVQWTDPVAEQRHGEKKTYDPGLPLHADWLPHVLAMLWALIPSGPTDIEDLIVERGGAREILRLTISSVPATIELERNGKTRTRIIEADSREGPLTLDFSAEPGTISRSVGSASADPAWPSGGRPLALMLSAFLEAVSGAPVDPRLDIATGHRANLVIDAVSAQYHRALLPWTAEKLRVSAGGADSDLKYRLAERLQAQGLLPLDVLEAKMAEFIGQYGGAAGARHFVEEAATASEVSTGPDGLGDTRA